MSKNRPKIGVEPMYDGVVRLSRRENAVAVDRRYGRNLVLAFNGFFAFPVGFCVWIAVGDALTGWPIPVIIVVPFLAGVAAWAILFYGVDALLQRRYARQDARLDLALELAHRAYRDAQAHEDHENLPRLRELVDKAQNNLPLFSRRLDRSGSSSA